MIKGSDWDIEKKQTELKEIDIANILGVSKMRHDASFGFSANDQKHVFSIFT